MLPPHHAGFDSVFLQHVRSLDRSPEFATPYASAGVVVHVCAGRVEPATARSLKEDVVPADHAC